MATSEAEGRRPSPAQEPIHSPPHLHQTLLLQQPADRFNLTWLPPRDRRNNYFSNHKRLRNNNHHYHHLNNNNNNNNNSRHRSNNFSSPIKISSNSYFNNRYSFLSSRCDIVTCACSRLIFFTFSRYFFSKNAIT